MYDRENRSDEEKELIAKVEAEANDVRAKKGKKHSPFSILYEDEMILALDKQAGTATIPERNDDGSSLLTLAGKRFGHLLTVHRLDKGTSGVIVFARNEEAHRVLNEQFRERTTKKVYAAVVEGELSQDEVSIDIPLSVDVRKGGRVKPTANGKESLTVVAVKERFRGYTFIEARPMTGRQHQIRVHCQAIGHPLMVDHLYGHQSEFFLSSIKRNYRSYGREERPLIDRLTLHAEELTIQHPGTGEQVTFHSPIPKDFKALLTQLRKIRPYSSGEYFS